MGKDIRYSVTTEKIGKFSDSLNVSEFSDAAGLLVALKPGVIAQPTVLEPDTIATTIMPTVRYGLAWRPQSITERNADQQEDARNNRTPWWAFQ